MSLIIKKRPHPDQKLVNTIKIRKLENENYQIESREDDSMRSTDANDSYNPLDDYQSGSQDMYNATLDSYNSSMYEQDSFNASAYVQQQSAADVQDDGELVCTPSFDAFDSIIQSQEEEDDDSDEPYLNLPLEIKIESVTSLKTPTFDLPQMIPQPQPSQQQRNHPISETMIKDRDVYMESIYRPDEMPRGGSSAASVTQMLKERNIRPLRHLAYIFADDGNRYFPCHCCTSAFIKKYLLIKHYGAKHKDVLVCKLCASIFNATQMHETFQQHMRAHNMRSSLQTKQCPLCLFWLSPRYYQGHLSIHNLLQKHFCRQCKQEFPSFYARAKHMCPIPN